MPGTLFVVATPIGNLADASPRAIDTLRSADVLACEDTRTTQVLLARHGVSTRAVALHAHNEQAATAKLLAMLQEGKNVALVSDAGTPAVSDPGARLVEAAHRAGVDVRPIPGPNAAIAAWSAAGFVCDRFQFFGFLPATGSARRKALAALEDEIPVIFYEAPHRVAETTADLLARYGAEREILFARELTKKFEESARMPLAAAADWLAAGPHRMQGEFVIVVGPGRADEDARLAEGERVLSILLETTPASEAARLASRITGVPKNTLYRIAIARGK